MNADITEQLWQLAAEELPEAQATALQQTLEADAELRQQFQEIQLLHQQLGRLEAEAPSMRFAKNVLERLPEPTQGLVGRWLLPARWWQALAGLTVGLIIVALFSLATVESQTGSATGTNFGMSWKAFIPNLSQEFYYLLFLSSLTLIGVVLLDRIFQRRFGRKGFPTSAEDAVTPPSDPSS